MPRGVKPTSTAEVAHQVAVELAAGQVEREQQWSRSAHVGAGGAAPEAPAPAHQFERGAGPHVERAHGVEQPLQGLADHPRRGQRHEVAGHHDAGVAVRSDGVPGAVALEHGDLEAAAAQVVGAAQADHAGTHHEGVAAHAAAFA